MQALVRLWIVVREWVSHSLSIYVEWDCNASRRCSQCGSEYIFKRLDQSKWVSHVGLSVFLQSLINGNIFCWYFKVIIILTLHRESLFFLKRENMNHFRWITDAFSQSIRSYQYWNYLLKEKVCTQEEIFSAFKRCTAPRWSTIYRSSF